MYFISYSKNIGSVRFSESQLDRVRSNDDSQNDPSTTMTNEVNFEVNFLLLNAPSCVLINYYTAHTMVQEILL